MTPFCKHLKASNVKRHNKGLPFVLPLAALLSLSLFGCTGSTSQEISTSSSLAGTASLAASSSSMLSSAISSSVTYSIPAEPLHACAGNADNAWQTSPVQLPGKIEAEDFDLQGFSDTTQQNEGGAYRNTAVDIAEINEGFSIVATQVGEYLDYTVNVLAEGAYDITIRAGASAAGRTFAVSQCGTDLLSIAVPFTGQESSFTTVSAGSIHLDPGLQVIRFTMADGAELRLDWVHIGPYSGEIDSPTPIAFGTDLKPDEQIQASREFAQNAVNSTAQNWRAKGDQKRSYYFPEANTQVGYRLAVPTSWDGSSPLPLVMFLHGAGADENTYVDQNNQQMVKLANQYGFILVSAKGYNGAYGNVIRLPAVFGQPDEAAKMLAGITPQRYATEKISEKDVINVVELVRAEYPINDQAMFLTGHSMGSGGTWYIGGKYANYWAALAPMSGPFVQETGYPWENLSTMPLLVTEGTGATPSLAGSRLLRDWLMARDFQVTYKEVNADHGGMVPLVLPDVFEFFNKLIP